MSFPYARRYLVPLLLLSVSAAVRAGDWHNSQTSCSECHTEHNSESGAPVAGNTPAGSQYVLRRASPEELCMSCHDGSGAGAANVLSTNSSYVAAAGFFAAPIGPTTHHLVKTATPPNTGGTDVMVLTCTTCHDPHGNTNYRNLRSNPNPYGGPITSSFAALQSVVANGTNPSAVYIRTNIVQKRDVSRFCETCHGEPFPGSDHPVDVAMWGSLSASYPDWACTNSMPKDFCSNPAQRTFATSPSDDVMPSQDDQVNCLSCHRAHGTANMAALYYGDNLSLDATCQQCHNQ